MKQEAPEKLLGGNRHQPLLALVGIIFPPERDVAIGNLDDPVIGDSHPMRVAGQVLENVLRSSERPLGVNNPIVAKQWPKKGMESLCLSQWFEAAREHQLALVESALQTGNELAAKHTAQYLHREKEGIARVNPSLAIG